MKSSIVVFFIIVLSITCFSQNNFQLTNYESQTHPPSPTTAALGEYGFAPIDLSSGQINFSVPIHTIQGQSISLPINFSYRAGVKIEETSPYTGHGWSMLAGGVITRSINGAVDPTPRIEKSTLSEEWDYTDATLVSQMNKDAAPDVFNYNFMGYTGQFVLEDDFETPYYIKEQRNWLVDIDFGGFADVVDSSITIVVEDGTKYIFEATETTSYLEDESDYFGEVITAWHLTEIISATTDEKIELTYYHEDFGKPILPNRTLILNPFLRSTDIEYHPDIHISFKSKKLDEIILYKDNIAISKVIFEANTTRFDITSSGAYNAKALSKISIFDDPNSSIPLKYFEFDIENANNERLFLKSIQEFFGDGSSSMPPYTFEYISEDKLPSRLASKADHWGYYSKENGAEFPSSDQVNWFSSKSKEPSSTAEYGSLKKVFFPTGGYHIFNYENNQYTKTDQVFSNNIRYDVSKTLRLNWRIDNNITSGGGWYDYKKREYSNYESYEFVLDTAQFVKLDLNLTLEKTYERNNRKIITHELSDHAGDSNLEKKYHISVINTDTNEEVFTAYLNGAPYDGDGEIALYVFADNWVEFKDPQDGSSLNPNDIAENRQSSKLNFYQRFFLSEFEKQSDDKKAYVVYGEDFFNENIGNDITIGEHLRPFYLDLEEGNYEVIVKTNTINNYMLNYSSEMGVEMTYRVSKDAYELLQNDDDDLVIVDPIRNGGGIRIKSQIIGTEDGEKIISYDYVIHDEYGVSTSNSSAQISEQPNILEYTPSVIYLEFALAYNYQLPTTGTGTVFLPPSSLWGSGNYLSNYIHTDAPLFSIRSKPSRIQNSWITYSEVKVTNGEEHANAGFTIYKYPKLTTSDQLHFSALVSDVEYESLNDDLTNINSANGKSWPYNQLLETNSNYSKPESILEYRFKNPLSRPELVKQENYEYYNFTNERLLTTKVHRLSLIAFTGTSFFERRYSLLKSKETLVYDLEGENPLITKVDYEYNNPTHNLLTKVITTDSQGDQIIKKTKYVSDYLNATSTGSGSSINMYNLKNDNILVPIEEQIWKGNTSYGYTLINGTLKVYDRISTSGASNNLYQPIEYLNLEIGKLTGNGFSSIDFIKYSNFSEANWINGTANYNYETNVNLSYYSNGNLEKVAKKDGIETYYIWGYNQTQPIAKIEGYTSINSSQQSIINDAISTSNNDDDRCLNSETCNEKTLRDNLALLRDAFPDAFVTTFTYDPLIGVTSITDPRGIVTYYEYDNLNRLEQIKGTDEKIVSKNEYYYYKGQ